MQLEVKFYGTGGSCAASSRRRVKYGANTSCMLVRAKDRAIIFDMGTGIIELANELQKLPLKQIDIFLSHFHYDHIEGFPFIKPLLESGGVCTLYAEPRMGRSPVRLLEDYMCPPYFPVKPDIYKGRLAYRELQKNERILLGDAEVATCALNHPDGATAFGLSWGGKKIVSLLDNELTEESFSLLRAFSEGAALLVCDTFFTDQETADGIYDGWGHSSYEQSLRLARAAGAQRLAMTHHAIWRSDRELDILNAWVKEQSAGAFVAYDGLEITI